MSEIPDSIPNNFSIPPEQTSGVIPVESRVYHAYTEHPHPLNSASSDIDLGPTKVRGIVYTDTTLGGKPFTIAERPGSKPMPDDATKPLRSPAPSSRRSHVEDWGFALTRDEVQPGPLAENWAYRPDSKGNVFFTAEYSQLGDRIVWDKLPETRRDDRRILITTEAGDEYYIYNDRVFDLQRSRGKQPAAYSLQDRAFADITIGQGWDLGKQGITDNIDSVEVFLAKMPQARAEAGNFEAEDAGNVRNRFAELERIINHNITTSQRNPASAPTRGDRLRAASGSAWDDAVSDHAAKAGEAAKHKAAVHARKLAGRLAIAGAATKEFSAVLAHRAHEKAKKRARRLAGRLVTGAYVMLEVHEAVAAEAKASLQADEEDD